MENLNQESVSKEIKEELKVLQLLSSNEFTIEDAFLPFFNTFILGVTSIDVSFDEKTKEVTLTITLQRPGLIIGKGGRNIDRLKTRLLENVIGIEDVIIKINESKLFD